MENNQQRFTMLFIFDFSLTFSFFCKSTSSTATVIYSVCMYQVSKRGSRGRALLSSTPPPSTWTSGEKPRVRQSARQGRSKAPTRLGGFESSFSFEFYTQTRSLSLLPYETKEKEKNDYSRNSCNGIHIVYPTAHAHVHIK